MYKNIERFYKENSPYSRIKKWILTIYTLFIVISFVLNFYKKIVIMLILVLVFYFVMLKVCEKILKRKLDFKLRRINGNESYLSGIISSKELLLFKDYVIKNNYYNEKSLLCIIGHYRKSNKIKVIGINLLSLLSLFLPLITAFYTKDGFNLELMISVLPNAFVYIFIIILLYGLFSQFVSVVRMLKGEDSMPERLEEIFSTLYIDLVNKNK